jgi:dTDP-4-dehydrorhamnose reductase
MHAISYPTWHSGIYNFSNAGVISWYDFAVEIKAQVNSKCTVKPIPTSSYPTPAKRPAYSVMDKKKLTQDFEYVVANWKESLSACIQGMKNK